MEQRLLRDEVGLRLEPRTLLTQHRLEVSQGIETLISHGGVGELPDAFDGLEFRRIRREAHNLDARRVSLLCRDMKAAIVFDHQDVMVIACPYTLGEGSHDQAVRLLVECGEDPKATVPRFRVDKSVDVEPFVPGLDRADQWLPRRCPDGSEDGFQAQSVFIHRPERHSRMEALRAAERLH